MAEGTVDNRVKNLGTAGKKSTQVRLSVERLLKCGSLRRGTGNCVASWGRARNEWEGCEGM